jgi:hypothetical protein
MGNSEMPADPIRRAIMDKAAWESFWNSYVSNREPRPAAPAIDFAKEFVVVVSQGQKSSAGYNLTIDDVAWEASDEAEARFTETTPGPTCGNAAVMTHPIHMVAAKRPSGADPAVRFEAKTATKAC